MCGPIGPKTTRTQHCLRLELKFWLFLRVVAQPYSIVECGLSGFLGIILAQVKTQPRYRPSQNVIDIKLEYKVDIAYSKTFRAKDLTIHGSHAVQTSRKRILTVSSNSNASPRINSNVFYPIRRMCDRFGTLSSSRRPWRDWPRNQIRKDRLIIIIVIPSYFYLLSRKQQVALWQHSAIRAR